MDKAATRGTDNPLLDELGQPREVLEKLTPEESAQLLGLLRKAKVAHQRSLNDSLDDGLKVLPRLIRPAARKILFGR
ncbi:MULTISPECIES: hypothetical protein [unclassified Mycobacterium]|uniref:hypothetical protein n=1 Tax=unclassified Mycobacterium TaxID=2642494 RepID=UPI000363856D|nr:MULTISPECIES: hypothetical protein [unclassified Mycobacterium]SEB26509.1 hypothetical protein SAMN04488580_12080 [Mycobacterium sp. 283mftsu]